MCIIFLIKKGQNLDFIFSIFSLSCCDFFGLFRRSKHIRSDKDDKSDYACHYVAKSESYFSHHSIFKCVGLESIYYVINLCCESFRKNNHFHPSYLENVSF